MIPMIRNCRTAYDAPLRPRVALGGGMWVQSFEPMDRNQRYTRRAVILLAVALMIGMALPHLPHVVAEDDGVLTGLDIQVTSPQAVHAAWIETLLTRQGARVTIGAALQAGAERRFDLIIIAGKGRRFDRPTLENDGIPILGVGSAGHAYFGARKLKHGSPFS